MKVVVGHLDDKKVVLETRGCFEIVLDNDSEFRIRDINGKIEITKNNDYDSSLAIYPKVSNTVEIE